MARAGNTAWDVFYAVRSTTTTNAWQTWTKPLGAQWIGGWMLAAGGGGGKATAGAQTQAPGGGACGGWCNFLIPAFLFPDVLYVRVGLGGAGASVAGAGGTGTQTYLSVRPNTAVAYTIFSIVGAAGSAGAATFTGGVAGAAAAISDSTFYPLCLANTAVGLVGYQGAVGSNLGGTGITWGSHAITTPGAGGGNGTAAGGGLSANIAAPDIGSGASGGAGTIGGAGAYGVGCGKRIIISPGMNFFSRPFTFTGGYGGGGHTTGQAGKGGDAGYGGGGGGGGGTTGAGGLSGNGGNGGDGLLLIGAF